MLTHNSHDISIALAHEIKPFLQDGPEFEFIDPTTVPLKIGHNSPLVSGLTPFADCAEPLNIHPVTASILDDMRFLINAVLTLPSESSQQDLQKVRSTAAWIHDRISNLDQAAPSPRPSSAAETAHGQSSKRGSISPRRGSGSRSLGGPTSRRQTTGRDVEGRTASFQNSPPAETTPRASNDPENPVETTKDAPPETETPPPPAPDYMYLVVRMAALVYARSVMERRPLGEICTPNEFLQIWTGTWRVPLSTWKAMNGVFVWVMISIAPRCHKTPHERFVKSLLVLGVQTMALDNWHVTVDAVKAGMKLQSWLREEDMAMKAEKGKGPESSWKSVEEHGYHQPAHWVDPGASRSES